MTMKPQTVDSRSLALALVAAVTVLFSFSASAGAAEKGREDPAQGVLEDRLRQHCKPLVGLWLRSEGMSDPGIQARAADCYLSHVRLGIMGVDWGLGLSGATISEVPGRILESRSGMSLDFYPRLAGRSFDAPVSNAGQVLKMPTVSTGADGDEVQ